MADVTQTAESSPAAEPKTPAQEFSIPRDPEGYARWRQTGETTPEPSNKGVSATPKSDDEKSSGKAAPVSETGDHKRQERTTAETRVKELLEERAQIRAELDALKAGRKDVKSESSPDTVKHDKAESSPASEGSKRPVKPKQEEFDSWDKYEAAQDKYLEDLTNWKATQLFEERDQKQRQEAATREMQTRLDEAKSRYGDEAEPKIISTAKTVFDDQAVAPALKAAIGRSDVMVHALYVMGSDANELSVFVDLAKRDPLEALRKWFVVEALVKEQLGKTAKEAKVETITPERGPDGKFLPEKAPRKSAPPPPVELNGNTTPTGDASERAANSGDFRAFKANEDRKELLRVRGQ